MAGRPARLRFRNAPHVTMTNVHNFTRTVRYNGDIEVDPAKLAVTGAVPSYLNYDWVLEDGAQLDAPHAMLVHGDINFVGPQTLEELVTFQKGLEIDTVGMTVSAGGIEAVNNDIVATAGAISAGTTVTAAGNIESTNGNICAVAGNITCGGNISAGGSISSKSDFNVLAGGLLVSAGDVSCHDQIEAAGGNIIATGAGNGAIEATAGSITAVTGNVIATTGGVAITGSGDLQVDAGNITASTNVTATAGAIEAGTTVTAGAALAVVDPLTVTHTITGTAGGEMEWDGTTLTTGGAPLRSLYSATVNLAAAATGTILEAPLALNTRVAVDAILNGYVSGDVGNANIGAAYIVRVFASYENVGGVLAAAAAYVTAEEVIHNGLVPASVVPVFTTDINVANWRITVDNGDDGIPVDNHILWRGEARVLVTAL